MAGNGRGFIGIGVILLAVASGFFYFISPAEDNVSNNGGAPPGADIPRQLYPSPETAVSMVYRLMAEGSPAQNVCVLPFTQLGAQQFAKDFGAPSCEQAVQQLTTKITDTHAYAIAPIDMPYSVAHYSTKNLAIISSCDIGVHGGPSLGKFVLTQQSTGWIITGHQRDPDPCPGATSNSNLPTSNSATSAPASTTAISSGAIPAS